MNSSGCVVCLQKLQFKKNTRYRIKLWELGRPLPQLLTFLWQMLLKPWPLCMGQRWWKSVWAVVAFSPWCVTSPSTHWVYQQCVPASGCQAASRKEQKLWQGAIILEKNGKQKGSRLRHVGRFNNKSFSPLRSYWNFWKLISLSAPGSSNGNTNTGTE